MSRNSPDDKKERIRRAAVTCAARKGFERCTIEEIAATAGVSVGTIYNYFHNKEAILDHIFETEFRRRQQFFEALQREGLGSMEKLRRFLTLHLGAVCEDDSAARILLGEGKLPGRCMLRGVSRFEGLPSYLEHIIRQGVAAGEFRPCDPRLLASILAGAVEAMAARFVQRGGDMAESEVTAALEELFDLLHRGLTG